MAETSLNDERFNPREAAGPLRHAVEELARQTGRPLAAMELLTLGEIAELAQETYGAALPPFWKSWLDWHSSDAVQPMGDL